MGLPPLRFALMCLAALLLAPHARALEPGQAAPEFELPGKAGVNFHALAIEHAHQISLAQAQDLAGMAAFCFLKYEVIRVPVLRRNIKSM